MRRIWLPNGEPGIEYHGQAYRLNGKTRQFQPVGPIELSDCHFPHGHSIPLRLRHATFQIDQIAQEGM